MIDLDVLAKLILRAGIAEQDRRTGIMAPDDFAKEVVEINQQARRAELKGVSYMDLIHIRDASELRHIPVIDLYKLTFDTEKLYPVVVFYDTEEGPVLKAGYVVSCVFRHRNDFRNRLGLMGFDSVIQDLGDPKGYLALNGKQARYQKQLKKLVAPLANYKQIGRFTDQYKNWLGDLKPVYKDYYCQKELINGQAGGFVRYVDILTDGEKELAVELDQPETLNDETLLKSLVWIDDRVGDDDQCVVVVSSVLRCHGKTKEQAIYGINNIQLTGFGEKPKRIERGLVYEYRFNYRPELFTDLDHELQYMLNNGYYDVLEDSSNKPMGYVRARELLVSGVATQVLKTTDSTSDLQTQQAAGYMAIRHCNFNQILSRLGIK